MTQKGSGAEALRGKKKVAVLMGSWNGEREVSLSSGEGVVKALEAKGYAVTPIDVKRDMSALLKGLTPRPDVVFMNALHGRWVEDGCLQGLLEMMKLPYTNSGVLASALAMNKAAARQMMQNAGIPCAEGGVFSKEQILAGGVMPMPYVVKPIGEGSSLGVHIIKDEQTLSDSEIDDLWTYGDEALVERYIPGHEIQVGIMGDRALGAIELIPKTGFYDYRAKYTDGLTRHVMPAPLPPEAYKQALELSLKVHRLFGCEGVSRVDLRYDDTDKTKEIGDFYVLEINPQPGMTPLSLVPEMAAHQGISFEDLVEWMVENPRCPD